MDGGHVSYLGQDQQSILNWAASPNSCTTVAIHMVQFLMYTGDNPTVESVLEHMTRASHQWLEDHDKHQDRYEQTLVAFQRLAVPNATMRQRHELDVWGMNVQRQVTSEARSNAVDLAYGFKEGLTRLLNVLEKNKRPGRNVAGATVVYGDYTFAVCIKLNEGRGNHRLVIDVVDSHRKILSNPVPPRDVPFGSAVWGRFFTVEGAAKFMEALYPPKPTDADLNKLNIKLDEKATDRQRKPGESAAAFASRMESMATPQGMFEMQVFTPIRASRAEAEEAIRAMTS